MGREKECVIQVRGTYSWFMGGDKRARGDDEPSGALTQLLAEGWTVKSVTPFDSKNGSCYFVLSAPTEDGPEAVERNALAEMVANLTPEDMERLKADQAEEERLAALGAEAEKASRNNKPS